MKIRIHQFLEDFDLTDGQKVLAALLATAFNNEGPRSEFYFHVSDIRVMLRNKQLQSVKNTDMMPFIAHYTIAEWTRDHWSFRLKDPKKQSRAGNVAWVETELTDEKSINIYHYILGRLTPWERGCMDHTGIRDFNSQEKPYTHWLYHQLHFQNDAS